MFVTPCKMARDLSNSVAAAVTFIINTTSIREFAHSCRCTSASTAASCLLLHLPFSVIGEDPVVSL